MNKAYEKYIHNTNWKTKKNERLEIDDHKCTVCGGKATEVHHLSYERFMHEDMKDLVSMCHKCHKKAEEFSSSKANPWSLDGNSFMAAMRIDAEKLTPEVFDYLKEVRGSDFNALLSLREPADCENRKYWGVLSKAVNSLCRKRYSRNCVEDRTDIIIGTLVNRVTEVCLRQIEHDVRNSIQSSLHEIVMVDYTILGKWKAVSEHLGINTGTLKTLRHDDGSSAGPTLREAVLYYCGLDAAAGISPLPDFECLSDNDYTALNSFANYMRKEKDHA